MLHEDENLMSRKIGLSSTTAHINVYSPVEGYPLSAPETDRYSFASKDILIAPLYPYCI